MSQIKSVLIAVSYVATVLAVSSAAYAQDDGLEGLDALFAEPTAEPTVAPVTSEVPVTVTATDAVPDPAPEAALDAAPPPSTVDALSEIEVESLRAPVAAPTTTDEEAPRQIEEIVVTAQKTKQSLQQVPVSVTAVSGEFIAETGSVDLADVSLYVPNVRVDADDLGSPQIFIRGFGTNAFNPSFEGSVGFVQDEIYYGRPGYFTESMFDIDRVEVLRGPQGTLFGKNTIAGVFNVSTVEPTGEFSTNASYSYGENQAHHFEAGAGGELTDWMGMRVSGLYRKEDGELYNQYQDRDEESLEQKAGRVRLRFYPSLNVQTELLLQTSETEAPFWPYQLKDLDADTRAYLQSFDADMEDDPYDFITSTDTPGYIEKGSNTAALNTQWQIGEAVGINDLVTTLIIGYSDFYIDQLNELDVSPADIARLDSHEDHKQLTGELRFTGNADSLFGLGTGVEFVAGGFFYDSNYVLDASILAGADLGSFLLTSDFRQLAGCNLVPTLNPVLNPLLCSDGQSIPGIPLIGDLLSGVIGDDGYTFAYEQDVQSYAFFGQMTWNLNPQWALTTGLRVSREEKEVDSSGTANCLSAAVGVCVMATLLESQDYDQPGLRRSESDVSPKFILQYFASDDVNVYASWTKGFKSGGFNAISLTGEDLEYEPEEAQTAELGIKSQWLDRTLRINATLYATRFDNLQVLAFNGIFFDVSNAAAARSSGLEADMLWLTPWEPLSIMASVGVLDARYDEYATAPAPIRNPQTGELQLGATQDLSDKRIAFAPRTTGTLTPMLSFPVFNLMAKIAGDLIYQGDQYTDTDLDEATYVDAYLKYGARLMLSDAQDRWTLTLGGTNLGDKRVLNQVVDATFFPGTYWAQQASGRQLFAAISLSF
ncbi:MAG: TonB-dependent receptor [Pseudomonadota bacterium]|nr:TonB-dependent receptor [Pseudomonadota bacterium]